MSIKLKELTGFLEEGAPVDLAYDWDNVGLMLGSMKKEIKRVMVCLDITSKVAAEAIHKKVDLILSHHPLIFKGLKKINFDNSHDKLIVDLIKNDINVYSMHTNFDVAEYGLNQYLAEKLELTNLKNFKKHKHDKLFKLVVFVPKDNVDGVRTAITNEGAGWIGNYSNCTFMTQGIGTFLPLEGTNPFIGTKGKLETVEEIRLETIVTERILHKTVEAMKKAHPYEEVAYDIYPEEIKGKEYGLGKVGILPRNMKLEEFIEFIKQKLNLKHLRIAGNINDSFSKVAVFCGGFDGELGTLRAAGAEVLVTGDLKYHSAVDIKEMGFCAIDAGHFSTEIIFKETIGSKLKNRFPEVEIIEASVEEDPFIFA